MLMHAYQFRSYLVQLLNPRKLKNFTEMVLHHVCSMMGSNYCYFANIQELSVGATIISSFSDIWLHFGKILRDFNFHPAVVTFSYLIILFSWFITRNIYLTYLCFCSLKKYAPGQNWPLDP